VPLWQAFYTDRAVGERPQLLRQLNELDRVLDLLEQMNLRDQTEVPSKVTEIPHASGLTDTMGLEPMALIPRVLDRQQHLRRQLAAVRRAERAKGPQDPSSDSSPANLARQSETEKAFNLSRLQSS
jgi:hypothetical protein